MDPQGGNQIGVAAIYVVAAMALIGLADNTVPLIAQRAGLWQFHFLRALIALPLIIVLARLSGWTVRPRRLGAVAVRGALLGVSMCCYFGALGFLSVAEAAAGLFTAPLLVLVASAVVFRQRIQARIGFAIVLGFAGVLLVLKPDPTGGGWVAWLPLFGAVFYAAAALITRVTCAQEGALSLLAGFLVAMLALSGLGLWATMGGTGGFLSRGWVRPDAIFLLLTLGQAVTVIVGVGLITKAYLIAPATQVAGMEYVLLIFATFWGWILWRDMPDFWALAGIAMILASGGLLAMRPTTATLPS